MDTELSRPRLQAVSDRELPLFEAPIGLALIAVLRERGYQHATMEEVALRAEVSMAEFEEEFDGKADAAVRVLASAAAAFRSRVQDAFDSEPGWPDSLRAAARAAERWLIEHPECAWFGLVGALGGPELGRALREEVLRWGANLIDHGRHSAPNSAAIPESAPLFAIGAIADILRRRYEGSQRAGVRIGLPEMMHLAVLPYIGKEAAMRELPDPDTEEWPSWDAADLRSGLGLAEVRVDGHVDEGGQELVRARSASI